MDDPSGRVSKRVEFRAFWRFLDIFLRIYVFGAIMNFKNDKAAERTQLNEEDMENG